MSQSGEYSRREFVKTSATAAAALSAISLGLPSRAHAAGLDRVRVGLIGCGGRGTGAATDCLQADDGVEIVALADAFQDRIDKCLDGVRQWCEKNNASFSQRMKATPDTTFVGYDGYRKLLALKDVDVVAIATPVCFHPVHLEAAIQAGKHAFVEKPAGVDPPGMRKVIAAGELARQKGLAIVAGTQRRHQARYLQNAHAVAQGAIGKIRAGRVWWCGGLRRTLKRAPGQGDAEYMTRNGNWYCFSQMSGDHIVEQHVHNLDVANWFIGRPPVQALGFGGRARRQGGNQYDFFSVDLDYGDDVIVHSMCRQVKGCYTQISEQFIGTEGSTWGDGKLVGKQVAVPEFEEKGGPYVQEHRDLIRSIREGKPLNEARSLAEATLVAIMGRISAYTGQIVRWADLTKNQKSPWYNLTMQPAALDFEQGKVVAPAENVIPLAGEA
ncbi:MAG: Gfo/Idh/MocA family oxidoreductase [Planctomycetes bacterium]|jgi:predicted dehydrogenase|nr:Gfo/Idh/MocA family oxidoreductase [Planctomycetota bacterium]